MLESETNSGKVYAFKAGVMMKNPVSLMMAGLGAAGLLAACTTVTLKGSEEEPIVVNLNVKIDQEVRIKMDKEIDDLIADNPDIF